MDPLGWTFGEGGRCTSTAFGLGRRSSLSLGWGLGFVGLGSPEIENESAQTMSWQGKCGCSSLIMQENLQEDILDSSVECQIIGLLDPFGRIIVEHLFRD